MGHVIPYSEHISKNGGAFINPNGKILFTYGNHEKFAQDFCRGKQYRLLSEVKSGDMRSYYSTHFDEFQEEFGFSGEREDIDEYQSSKLTMEQLKLYKFWLEHYEMDRKDLHSDFMVHLLGYDKAVDLRRRIITTTDSHPHVKYFNYYLMGWDVEELSPMYYDKGTERFHFSKRENGLIRNLEDRNAECEIDEIKANVLLKDRPLFFK